MNKLKHLLSLLMLICFSVGNVWATGANTLATYEFTNGTTMPTNVSNSGGVAFATTRFCFNSNNDNIVITPTIPQNATTLYIAVKGFMNSTSASAGTIGIYGLSSTNAAVSGASGTYTQSTGSATNATGCDNAATDEDEISFSATGVAKIKINCDTYSKKYIIRTVTITYDTNGGGSQEPTVCEEPEIEPEDGSTFYGASQEVSISCGTENASIYYTLDGTVPSSTNGTLYEDPFDIEATTTVKAIAIKSGLTNSSVVSYTITKGEDITSYDIDFEAGLAAPYVNWTFTNAEFGKNGDNDNISGRNSSTHYGTTGGKSKASIATSEVIEWPGTFTCYVSKQSGNTTSSTWYIQVSDNGSNWANVKSQSATSMNAGTWVEFTADLSAYHNVYVRLYYDGTTAIRNIEDISLSMRTPVESTILWDGASNGSFVVKNGDANVTSGDDVQEFATLTITTSPDNGFKVKSVTVEDEDEDEVEVTLVSANNYQFVMPAKGALVYVEFESAKTLTGISLSGNYRTTFWVGETFSSTGLVVTANYDDLSSATVTPASITGYNMSTDGNQTVTVSYTEGTEKTATYDITVKALPTEANPATVAEIRDLYDKFGNTSDMYVKGTIYKINGFYSEKYITYWITDSYDSEAEPNHSNEFELYNGLDFDGADFTAATDLEVGQYVIVKGDLTKYSSTYEFAAGNEIVSRPKVLKGIALSGTYPTEFTQGDEFSSEGLVVTASYNYGEPTAVTPTSITGYNMAATGNQTVTVSYTEGGVTKTATYGISVAAPDLCEHKATISKGEEENGTFELSVSGEQCLDELEGYKTSTVLTATPAEHYHLSEVTATVGTIGTISENSCTISNITANTTITAVFAEDDKVTVKFAMGTENATGDVPADVADKYAGQSVTLPANPFTYTGEPLKAFGGWKHSLTNEIKQPSSYTITAADAAEDNITFTAVWNDLSPWATTYTSNVAMAHTGSGVDNGTITIGTDDPYLLVKAGASSSTGTIVVTVPKGTTDLHFHAFAWGGKTAKIELAGVENASVSEFDLAGEAGASGSGNDFTLQGDPVDQYFHVSFDAVAAETEITFSKATGSADNRFFFYGVNQEGGLILESISVSGTATALEYNEGDHFSPAGLGVTGHYSDASTAPITEGIVWAFDPDPLTEGTESVSVTATAGGFTSAAFVVNGLTVNGAAPLSPWATTYTSNVAMAHTGSGVDNGTITIGTDDPYLLVKAGASSSTGTIVVTVPKGTTDLHFHAFAWGGKTAKIELAGVENASVSEFDLAGEAGASGSGNDFTLQGDPVDQYFHVSFDAVAAETEITFSKATGSADNRFFFYGVNQEGGILPVLESIEIAGDLTNKEYEAGAAINPAGLTVMGTYTLGGTPQTPVDVTDQVEEWLYEALAAGDESVTISAKIGTVTSEGYEISGLTVTDPTPRFETNPTTYISFGTKAQGAEITARDLVVTLVNVSAASVEITGEGKDAFSVDETALTGNTTLHVSASSANLGTFAATLTISDDAGVAADKEISLSLTVEALEIPVSTTSEWVAATDGDIVDGAVVLIVGVKEIDNVDHYYAMGSDRGNNRFAIAGTVNEGVFTPGENTMSFTLVDQGDDTFALRASNGNYLYAGGTGNNNYLNTKAYSGELDANAKWNITISSIVATSTDNRNDMRFNYNNNNPALISCYQSTSTYPAVTIYVPKPAPAPDYGSYNRDQLTIGDYGTICLPKAGTISGAVLFAIGAYEGGMIMIDEIGSNEMIAGRPYIFQAIDNELTVEYSSNDEAVASSHNGLYGSFDKTLLTKDEGNYILYNNLFYYVNSTNVYVGANRAYIKIGMINYTEPAPGRRRVAMSVNGNQMPTEVEGVEINNAPRKVVINGELYILRGEKMYDVRGQLVK